MPRSNAEVESQSREHSSDPTATDMEEGTEERRRPRLLIVEDDPDIVMLIGLLARRALSNIEIQSVSTVHEATALLDEGRTFDLVIADFMLADSRSGYELRELFRERSVPCKFAMMSSMPLEFPELSDTAFLQKPFTPDEAKRFIERSFHA